MLRSLLGFATICLSIIVASYVTSTTFEPPSGPSSSAGAESLPSSEHRDFGQAPAIPAGEVAPDVLAALDVFFDGAFDQTLFEGERSVALDVVASSGDPRVAWPLADILRFIDGAETNPRLQLAAAEVLGIRLDQFDIWTDLVDHLTAWDIPAPSGYVSLKRRVYSSASPSWEPFFEEGTNIDYRHWAWGGVLPDDRPPGDTDTACRCIPAVDDPATTDADGGRWYADDRIVVGVVINGEARAYPRNILEIRELVNDTIGGRDIALPYCTLCGSAQVWFTDELSGDVDRPVMRTSGLLNRSNKVMFDIVSGSAYDSFHGTALTGPHARAGVQLRQHGSTTTTWGEWKAEHPQTTILAESLALGRDSNLRDTRDARGPIFPIGNVDPRLPSQEDVFGVIGESGTPIAFHVETALNELSRGFTIDVDGVVLIEAAGGLVAVDRTGRDLGGHQAFWFAWSQFNPQTRLWPS